MYGHGLLLAVNRHPLGAMLYERQGRISTTSSSVVPATSPIAPEEDADKEDPGPAPVPVSDPDPDPGATAEEDDAAEACTGPDPVPAPFPVPDTTYDK